MSFSLNPLKALASTVSAAVDTVSHLAKGDVMGAVTTLGKAVDDVVPDAGDVFEELADEVLPPELEWVGDLLSAAANLENPLALVSDLADLAENFPGAEPPQLEEIPTGFEGLESDPGVVSSHPPTISDDPEPGISSAGGESQPPTGQSSSGSTSSTSASPGGSVTPNAGTPAASSPDTDKRTAEAKGKDAAKSFIASHSDPEAFMNAIKEGNLPEDVVNSQAGMMMIQQRMNEIQRMFQMMTQMTDAMHQMNMAIVRNIRAG